MSSLLKLLCPRSFVLIIINSCHMNSHGSSWMPIQDGKLLCSFLELSQRHSRTEPLLWEAFIKSIPSLDRVTYKHMGTRKEKQVPRQAVEEWLWAVVRVMIMVTSLRETTDWNGGQEENKRKKGKMSAVCIITWWNQMGYGGLVIIII